MDGNDLKILERRGWSDQKARVFRESFLEFCQNLYINSKDSGGHTCLGDHLYWGQIKLLDEVLNGLKQDIHDFKIVKSRQLGMSTFSRALDIFYLGVHPGLPGASVMDTDSNKKSARREIETMIENLPEHIKFPRFKGHDRDGLTLENESSLLFLSAGTKKTTTSGTLGRSVGLSLCHCSEVCSWADNGESIESFRNSLSDNNPDRFYLWESTARGYNLWHEMCEEAKEDIHNQKFLYFGGWCKDTQKIDREHPDFQRYGVQAPTDKERQMIALIQERYGWAVTPEQLAWRRKRMDPTAEAVEGLPVEYEGDAIRRQEQSWYEEETWQMTGATFFSPESLKALHDNFVSQKYKGYWFAAGVEFINMKVHEARTLNQAELKVWQEPQNECTYVVCADVAHGADEDNDRSAISVLKCYADGCDQVAEYASPLITTKQFAWVIMTLAAWYSMSGANVVYLIVELNGPGGAVWDEIRDLGREVMTGYQSRAMQERGLQNIFGNIRNYLYSRPDSLSSSYALMWKTSGGAGPSGKVRLMERFRDFVSNGYVHVRSADTVEEMSTVTRVGDTIEAEGSSKDDRVIALALGIRCWEERARRNLSIQKKTREAEAARRRLSIVDQSKLYNDHMLSAVFARKRVTRRREDAMLARMKWRGRV